MTKTEHSKALQEAIKEIPVSQKHRRDFKICQGCGQEVWMEVRNKFCSHSCAQQGARNSNWRAADAGYVAKHSRVHRLRGKAFGCGRCGLTDPEVRYEWANLSGDYNDPDDYESMCVPCHRRFDAIRSPRGVFTKELVARANELATQMSKVEVARLLGVSYQALFYHLKYGAMSKGASA